MYLPVELIDQLRAASDRTGASYTDVVLDAIEATHDGLAERHGWTPNVDHASSLFGRRDRRSSGRVRPGRQTRVQITLRPTRDQHAVLEQLQHTVGAPTLSTLVGAALDAYLSHAGG